jgi:hypothetical protein
MITRERDMWKLLMPLMICFMIGIPSASAEHADIVLRITSMENGEEAVAYSDQEPPAGGVKPRPVLKTHARERLVVQFILTNTYPHGVNKDVTVRYYIVPTKALGQKELPDLKGPCVIQGQFQMNFKPKCRVGARVVFAAPGPGTYLLRVDTLNTNSDHEHFSAVDLRVE